MHSRSIVWSERAPSSSWRNLGTRGSIRWVTVVVALSACLIALAVDLAAWQAGGTAALLG